ncbi:hypothetical protein AB0D49_32670 [Streptomyces sp. NPDC048290]|uniref:hypothetical protein n=1 Tax=Streptomyces sp. NPDC048290 TaxID=3155811 RepID=UPI00343A46A6
MTTPTPHLPLGSLAYDTVRGKLGQVTDVTPSRYFLRPPHGGVEWDPPHEHVRAATVAEQLSPALADRNKARA